MKIKLLGAHNCETLDFRHTCMVIDDIIAIDAGSLTANLSNDDQLRLKALIITHQHYDHIRDVSAFGVNLFQSGRSTDVFTTSKVIDVLNKHFFNSGIYRNFAKAPEDAPTFRLHPIEPLEEFTVSGYAVKAVLVNHSGITVGFQIISPDGKQFFYTADTGPGLSECWKEVSPEVLVIEVTESNQSTEKYRKGSHLTPGLLKDEMVSFREIHGYIPIIYTVHMSPDMEDVIRIELQEVAKELGCSITPGYEGMEISIQ